MRPSVGFRDSISKLVSCVLQLILFGRLDLLYAGMKAVFFFDDLVVGGELVMGVAEDETCEFTSTNTTTSDLNMKR